MNTDYMKNVGPFSKYSTLMGNILYQFYRSAYAGGKVWW